VPLSTILLVSSLASFVNFGLLLFITLRGIGLLYLLNDFRRLEDASVSSSLECCLLDVLSSQVAAASTLQRAILAKPKLQIQEVLRIVEHFLAVFI